VIQFTPDTPLAPVEKTTLIIAMTPRSGSTNLCSALTKLKDLGDPQEYFNPRGPMEHFSTKVTKTSSPQDYLAALAARADIFSFKIASVDWQPFAARAR
jgi:LPS sulfotransferase NodH